MLYAPDILKQLTLKQLEEAMFCLHYAARPKDEFLKSLPPLQWNELASLLDKLLKEKNESSLH